MAQPQANKPDPRVCVDIVYPESQMAAPGMAVRFSKAASLLRNGVDRELDPVCNALELLSDIATGTFARLGKQAAGVRNAEQAAGIVKHAKRKMRFGKVRR